MATTLLIRRSTSTATPASGALAQGELAYSYSSGNLFIGDQTGSGAALLIGGATQMNTLASFGSPADYLSVAGDAMDSGANITLSGGGEVLGLPATPSGATSATSKAYVDSVAQGLNVRASVRVATTTAGTLATSFVPGQVIDGVTLAQGDKILIKDQANAAENGCYIVQASGAPVRGPLADQADELAAAFYFVEEGTTQADTGWVSQFKATDTVDTDPINFVQFSRAGTIQAGNGLSLTGTVMSLDTVSIANGGTGLTTIGGQGTLLGATSGGAYTPITLIGSGITIDTSTDGQITLTSASGTVTNVSSSTTMAGLTLSTTNNTTTPTITLSGTLGLASGGTGLGDVGTANQILGISSTAGTAEYKTLTAGTGVSVTHAAGSVTFANTGVTSITGTSGEIDVSASTGDVTLSLPAATTTTSLTLTGLTANSFLYSGTGGLLTTTAAPTDGQLLIGSTGNAPVAATLTAGTGISITNAAGSITITNTNAANSGTVTSVDVAGGTTGLTFSGGPVTTSGTITMAGTLATSNGGTGLTSIGAADEFLAVNSAGTALTYVNTVDGGSF